MKKQLYLSPVCDEIQLEPQRAILDLSGEDIQGQGEQRFAPQRSLYC